MTVFHPYTEEYLESLFFSQPLSPAYTYTPFASREIRLLRIDEARVDTQTFELCSFTIAEAPPYTALSYRWKNTWGDEMWSERIRIDWGTTLQITKSLSRFLTEFRRRQIRDWIWIDAVSINQSDIAERNQQVQRMKDIYEGAESIVIWLGEGDQGDRIAEAFEFLERLARLQCEDLAVYEGSIPRTTCRIGTEKTYVDVLYDILSRDVSYLLGLDYFHRCWVIQEASTPKPEAGIVVWHGEHSMRWKDFREANRKLAIASWNNTLKESMDLHDIANEGIAIINYLQEQRQLARYSDALYTMLVRCRVAKASDPRDKVYSVRGLVAESQNSIQPDYSKSEEQVYIDVAIHLITVAGNLDCLGAAGRSSLRAMRDRDGICIGISGIPSWVPDWRDDFVPHPFYLYYRDFYPDSSMKAEGRLFAADGGLSPDIAIIQKDKLCLHARGHIFDTVCSSTRLRLPGDDTINLWTDWLTIAEPSRSRYPSGCSRFDAFVQVLTADIRQSWEDKSAVRGVGVDDFSSLDEDQFELGHALIDTTTYHRSLFRTAKGYIGLGRAKTDDVVCIVFGSQVPLVLRRQQKGWTLVGQAYVHGIMDGEAIEGLCEDDAEVFEIF